MNCISARIKVPLFFNADDDGNRERIPEDLYRQTSDELSELLEKGGTWSNIAAFPSEIGEDTSEVGSKPVEFGYWPDDDGVTCYDSSVDLEIMGLDIFDVHDLLDYVRSELLDRFGQTAIMVKFLTPPEFQELVSKEEAYNHVPQEDSS